MLLVEGRWMWDGRLREGGRFGDGRDGRLYRDEVEIERGRA